MSASTSASNQVPAPDPASARPQITARNAAGERWVRAATDLMEIVCADADFAIPLVSSGSAREDSELRKAVEAVRTDVQCMTRMEALIELARGVPTAMVVGLGKGWLLRQVDKVVETRESVRGDADTK